jgi:tetratricopeptide (TPR) repeat protein
MAYEQALRANPQSVQAMNAISLILRTREDFPKAVEYLQAILKIDNSNGEAWGSLGLSPTSQPRMSFARANATGVAGHCFLMMDDLQQAYAAYQSALVNLRNPKVSLLTQRNMALQLCRILTYDHAGASSLVRHWDPLRSLWLLGPCRGGLLKRDADATGL